MQVSYANPFMTISEPKTHSFEHAHFKFKAGGISVLKGYLSPKLPIEVFCIHSGNAILLISEWSSHS